MKSNIKLYMELPSKKEIHDGIMNELILQLNLARTNGDTDINNGCKALTQKLINNCDFIKGLSGAELRGSFGIRPREYASKQASIVKQIVDDTIVHSFPLKLVGRDIYGGWVLTMGTDLFESLKNSIAGITISEKKATIPWLKWTLEIGNRVIISNFNVHFQLGKGRSAFAHMLPNLIVGYRIPPQFAGTDYDNWITRTIIPHLDKYSEIILRTLDRHLP